MQIKTVWQQGSADPDNATHFATISQWWTDLDGQEITWRQRLIPASGNVSDLNWEPQRFDEVFVIRSPQVRGITLYWQKPTATEERNTTVHKLELDHLKQQLYIYPQSQLGLVIQVGRPQVVYQQVKLENPQWMLTIAGDRRVLVVRDEAQKLEIEMPLSSEQLTALKHQLESG
ncbi:hypothetical protein [Thermocoleostomius sinensis]|jgi:hypothetical protein|uniref:Uncharacterized protein n=1 Tax=Thermocoleostomius sinensis A174 TaxID=2016057 RepID=A0A9E8ZG01_9CYAN|nr:hypothetical protein [Thermocoleostomius sinensis]WAL62725.1 hypothetical protein OXH18_12245 [Thermocoleostomius sinensis A174]